MRLINIKTKELEEFFETEIPSYAILSHRWAHEELTFKEIFKKRVNHNKQGYKKLVKACDIAADCGLDYLWIGERLDTKKLRHGFADWKTP